MFRTNKLFRKFICKYILNQQLKLENSTPKEWNLQLKQKNWEPINFFNWISSIHDWGIHFFKEFHKNLLFAVFGSTPNQFLYLNFIPVLICIIKAQFTCLQLSKTTIVYLIIGIPSQILNSQVKFLPPRKPREEQMMFHLCLPKFRLRIAYNF